MTSQRTGCVVVTTCDTTHHHWRTALQALLLIATSALGMGATSSNNGSESRKDSVARTSNAQTFVRVSSHASRASVTKSSPFKSKTGAADDADSRGKKQTTSSTPDSIRYIHISVQREIRSKHACQSCSARVCL